MDMTGMNMTSSTNSTSNSTAAAAMDMGGGSCKISMLWNWTTIDACFLSKSWHVRTMGQFAGSVVGVFFLCMAIEAIRRAAREYDRRITLGARIEATAKGSKRVEVTWVQQAIRSSMYGSQFTASFLVMLLGMYYNGAILFAIFFGHTFGYLFFAKDTVGEENQESGCAC